MNELAWNLLIQGNGTFINSSFIMNLLSFSETPAFKSKLSWNPPKGQLCLEVFLSQVEKELFELAVSHLDYSNFKKGKMDSSEKFGR